MIEESRLWDRVHAALNARRDPLADSVVCEELLEHPEALAEILALRESLSALRECRESPSRRRIAIAVAATLALGALAGFTLRDTVSPVRESTTASDSSADTGAPLPEWTPPCSRVLQLFMQTTVRRPGETLVAMSDGRSLVRRSTLERAATDDVSNGIGATLVVASTMRRIQP